MHASFNDTSDYLIELGFIPNHGMVFLSPGEDEIGDFEVVIYKCAAGHYCVRVDGGYSAPCVWDGERLPMFVEWLDEHHAGWRG